MHLKSTLKRKSKICIKTLDFLDLLLPNFFCFYLFSFILFLENFFLEFWKISKVTPIYIYYIYTVPPSLHLLMKFCCSNGFSSFEQGLTLPT